MGRLGRKCLRKSLLSNSKEMGRAIGPLLPGVDLYHSRHVERIHACKRICGNQHDTRVCIDFFLQVAQLDGLEHCDGSAVARREVGVSDIPAGSFRWDRLVRSSLASNMAGFIKGGKLGSLPSWMAARVVSTVFFCCDG